MIAENIIEKILQRELSEAKSETEILLYTKMGERLDELTHYISANVYGNRFIDNINEGEKDGPEYKKFFRAALKKFGVSDPSELDDDKKKEFFDYVDNNWKSDDEESTGEEEPEEEEDEEDEEKEVEENMMLAPKMPTPYKPRRKLSLPMDLIPKPRKAAKALYQDTTTEEYEWN